MTTYVQDMGGTSGWNFTTIGMTSGNAAFFIGTGTTGGSPSVSAVTLGGESASGYSLLTSGSQVYLIAWWNSLSSSGDKAMAVTQSNITRTDSALVEVSGWTGTATALEDSNIVIDGGAGTTHGSGLSVDLSGTGFVLGASVYDAGAGTTNWAALTETANQGTREQLGFAIKGASGSTSGTWTSANSVTATTTLASILETADGGGASITQNSSVSKVLTEFAAVVQDFSIQSNSVSKTIAANAALVGSTTALSATSVGLDLETSPLTLTFDFNATSVSKTITANSTASNLVVSITAQSQALSLSEKAASVVFGNSIGVSDAQALNITSFGANIQAAATELVGTNRQYTLYTNKPVISLGGTVLTGSSQRAGGSIMKYLKAKGRR